MHDAASYALHRFIAAKQRGSGEIQSALLHEKEAETLAAVHAHDDDVVFEDLESTCDDLAATSAPTESWLPVLHEAVTR